MIVSHSKKFIYVKSKKTASTSIQATLEKVCADGDVIHNGWVHHHLRKGPPRKTAGHDTILQARKHLQDGCDYFSFSFVRNPHDQVVSAFWFGQRHLTQYTPFETIKRAFIKWLTPGRINSWDNWRLFTVKNVLDVDFVGRYECLSEDYAYICQRIGIETLPLPRLLSEFRRNPAHFSEYYDAAAWKLVSDLRRREIETFGY